MSDEQQYTEDEMWAAEFLAGWAAGLDIDDEDISEEGREGADTGHGTPLPHHYSALLDTHSPALQQAQAPNLTRSDTPQHDAEPGT